MKKFVLNTILFLFPFFFLNITQEYFLTNKFYLLGFGVLVLLLTSTVEVLFFKKISWKKNPLNNLILLFITSVALSTLFSSPNKIQALLNPNFGLLTMIFLGILYLYVSNIRDDKGGSPLQSRIYHLGSIILSLTTIVFFFQPFKNINLSTNLSFLKNPAFTPVGSQLDLAILLGFCVIVGISQIFNKGRPQGIAPTIYHLGSIIFSIVALSLTVFSLIKPNLSSTIYHPASNMPPFRLSWYAAIEILKNPLTAAIGVGPDNFSSVFTRVKDFAYNQSPLWQIHSFNLSHSAILQILTETGVFGLVSFGLLIFYTIKQLIKGGHEGPPLQIFLFAYLLICLFIFPPSLIIWFLFFVTIALISSDYIRLHPIVSDSLDLASLLPLYIGIIIISLALICTSGYFLGRAYLAELYFKKSIYGIVKNNLKDIYENQRQAIILNRYIERFHSSFAQTNFIIVNNLSKKNAKEISEQDKQTITQAIQSGIAEAKTAIALNPQRAENWQNLAATYLNIIGFAKGADTWTISAYQRAIVLDPQNPGYRIGLGGVYYSLNKYDEAVKFFEQAVSLKPDWANANYNYAWANFQLKNYPQAVNAMQNALSLIDKSKNKSTYEKIKKELDDFKKMLPK